VITGGIEVLRNHPEIAPFLTLGIITGLDAGPEFINGLRDVV
jgi:hypothetical protein